MRLRGGRHLIAAAVLVPAAIAAGRVIEISRGWEYRLEPDTSWRSLAQLDRAHARGHPGLWLRHNVPEDGPTDAELVFTGFLPRFSVFADSARIYDYDAGGTHAYRATIHSIPLPPQAKIIAIWIPHLEFTSLGIENPNLANRNSVSLVVERLANEPLTQDLPRIGIGILTLAGGLAVLALFFVRRRSRNFAWIYLGAASALYGARLLLDSPWISFTIGYPSQVWRWPIAFITYTIGIPSILLARNALGPGWKSSLNWSLGIQIVFSIGAIASDIFQGIPMSAERLNGAWALLFTLIILANAMRSRAAVVPGRGVLAFGFVVFIFTVANTNLTALHLPEWRPLGQHLEPYGFLVLLTCFAWFVVRRAFANEEKLLAVEVELETARRIQQSILPGKIPSISGLQIAARYIPMAAVAGDFYDFVQLDERRLGILVADVSGHGVPAALVASMVKIAFAGQFDQASDPAAVLKGMNEALHGRVQRQFVTAVYALIDAVEASIVYACAGHPPPLLRRAATNTLETLSKGGLVLGPFRKTPYTNCRTAFEPGDRLLIYTDGIVEAPNSSNELYGERCFHKFMQQSRLPAETFTDNLVEEVRRWSPAQVDDVTVVTVDNIRIHTAKSPP